MKILNVIRIAFFFGVFTIGQSYGQHTRFNVGINYGTFATADLKGLQNEFLNDLDSSFPAKVTAEFPSFIGFEGSVSWGEEKHFYGIEAGYNSTAGRVAYSDYSGKLLFDQFVRAPKIGFSSAFKLSESESQWETFFFFSGGTTFNTYELNYNLQTAQSRKIQSIKFKSINIYLSGGFGVTRNFKSVFVNMKMLYQKDIPSDLTLTSDKDAILINDNGDNVHVDWSGLRIALSFGIKI